MGSKPFPKNSEIGGTQTMFEKQHRTSVATRLGIGTLQTAQISLVLRRHYNAVNVWLFVPDVAMGGLAVILLILMAIVVMARACHSG